MTVSVEVPDLDGALTPASGIVVTALPFDRDSLVLTMEARAGTSRPGAAALDSLFALYREPFLEYFRAGRAREEARDSLASGAISQAEHDRVEARYQAAREALQRTRDQLDPAIDSLRAEVREWEHSTYGGFDTLAKALTEGRYHVSFEDIRALAHPVLRHRVLTNFRAESEGITSDALVDELLKAVPLPKSGM